MLSGTADATWSGGLQDGTGDVAVGSNTWVSRCATSAETDATNPAELLAGAFASALAMVAADALDAAGYTPQAVEIEADIRPAQTECDAPGPAVELTATGVVSDATAAEFATVLDDAVDRCLALTGLTDASVTIETTVAD